jgi:magnesium-protoporphyrin O-methyltransferase
VSRTVVTLQNLLLRAGGREFRTFTHPPAAMVGVLEEHGLTVRATSPSAVWQVVALSR